MDLLAALTTESARLTDVLADVDAAAPVPTCDGWTALDLAWHLTEVQTFWATMVEEQRDEPFDHDPDVGHPSTMAGCLEALSDATHHLASALESAPSDTPVWSWSERGGTAAWVRRRMAHEALVHRLDAEATAGVSSAVDDELARDGIDELVGDFLVGVPDWATFTPSEHHVALEPEGSDRTWTLALGRMTGTSPTSGTDYDLPAALAADEATPDLRVQGTAAAIDAWLWGRGSTADLRLRGDAHLAAELRAVVVDATQ